MLFRSLEHNQVIPDSILTAGPSISPMEVAYVEKATRIGWNQSHSDYIQDFEKSFAEYLGVKYALATSSCTGALHLAFNALGIGKGDEVIVPEITWVATASAVKYTGATPVFCEIDKKSWTIETSAIEKLITSKTKAISPVHLYGYPANMEIIMSIAKKYNLFVVEDAAPAIGAKVGEKFAGSFGDINCFSFQGAKMLVTGEGGMLVTNNEDLYHKARQDQEHGRKPGT